MSDQRSPQQPRSTQPSSTEGSAPQVLQGWTKDTIRIARKSRNLSQRELAEALGCQQQTVSEWEIGLYAPNRASSERLDKFFAMDGRGAQEGQTEPPSENRLPPTGDRIAAATGELVVTREQLLGAAKYMEMSELVELRISLHQAQQTFTMLGESPEEAARRLSS